MVLWDGSRLDGANPAAGDEAMLAGSLWPILRFLGLDESCTSVGVFSANMGTGMVELSFA